ncbi:uncharacterized protein M421DRAFT_149624 [Didymella exigua CBS 183.55]|uniref:Uncharacterized protein n=1 Tax=Didymella exigua CBS 183.55 TaxID=1150837 RepID=A0A6A5RN65_9PLEO|nr:uncharacterized protein M421DRAFT_149624 [Didymella exigua CBS 183.55]KAF1928578.1 hypothetical protein M421DRAFT_149624 [Didymella exigua CBS 183.55]
MPCTRLLARAYYSNSNSPNSNKTAIVVGLVCGVLAIGIGIVTLICCSNRSTRHGPESLVARSQELRRENNGWWGAAPPHYETATERRRRNLEIRATMGGGSGIARGARSGRDAREGGPAPPEYQTPAPACRTGRRQLVPSPLPQENDAPPAYEPRAVWPTGVHAP